MPMYLLAFLVNEFIRLETRGEGFKTNKHRGHFWEAHPGEPMQDREEGDVRVAPPSRSSAGAALQRQ